MVKIKTLKKQERGFTLIELMVVIVLIGVLAGIGLQYVIGAIEHARVNADIAEGRRIKDAIDVFYTKYGRTPGDIGELQSDSFSNGLLSAQKISGSSVTPSDEGFQTIFAIDLSNGSVTVYDITTGATPKTAWDSSSS